MKTNLFFILVFCFFSGSLFAQASTMEKINDFTAIQQSIQKEQNQSIPQKEAKASGAKQDTKTKKSVKPKVKSTPGHSHLARNRYLRTNHLKGKE